MDVSHWYRLSFYFTFSQMLGDIISIRELRYSGGLDTSDDVSDGDYVLIHQDLSEIVIFHVPMLMLLPPSDAQRQRMPVENLQQKLNFIRQDMCDVWKNVGDELLRTFQRRRSLTLDGSQESTQETQLLQRKRHIGNDWVQIIFTEVTKYSVLDRAFLKHVTPTNTKSLSLGGSFGLVNIFVYYYLCSIEEYPYVHVVVRLKNGAPKEIEFLETEQVNLQKSLYSVIFVVGSLAILRCVCAQHCLYCRYVLQECHWQSH